MEKTKRNIMMIIFIIIVAVMFVIGNIGYNNGSPLQKQHTTTIGNRYIVTGTSNAIIKNYSQNMILNINNISNSNTIYKILSTMQSNGLISSYNNFGNQIDILAGNGSTYQIYTELKNVSNSISINVTSYLKLPTTLILYYSGSKVRINIPNKTFTINGNKLYKIGTKLNISIQAMVTGNGSLYNNNLRIIKIS